MSSISSHWHVQAELLHAVGLQPKDCLKLGAAFTRVMAFSFTNLQAKLRFLREEVRVQDAYVCECEHALPRNLSLHPCLYLCCVKMRCRTTLAAGESCSCSGARLLH